jgi:SAM-dependent methyltransferase
MDWTRLLGSAVSSNPLPRAVLRHLLLAHHVGWRSRVLDVGCGRGELVHYLDDLGIDAAGLDESPDNIDCAKRLEPRSDFQLVTAPAEQSLEHIGNDEPLDLIVVRHLTTYDGNLFCASSFQATAKLMQHLRPGGWLVFLVHRDTGRSRDGAPHDVACFARHLSSFPGTCRVSHFADCGLATIANDWLHGHRHHGKFLVTSLRAPLVPMAAAAWQNLATQAADSHDDSCCSWATRAIEQQAA